MQTSKLWPSGSLTFHELIAVPCSLKPYTMPIGVIDAGDILFFRTFKNTGLGNHLSSRPELLLLAPYSPTVFFYSILHKLEKYIGWRGECPIVNEKLGSWISCSETHYLGSIGDLTWWSCKPRIIISGEMIPYSRVYGCSIEFLIYYTRVKAGIWMRDKSFEERMLYCINRTGGIDSNEAYRLALELLRSL